MIDATPFVGRAHPGHKTIPLALTSEQRAHCEALLRQRTLEQRIARRAQALILLADGVCGPDVAQLVGVHIRTVEDWRHRVRTDAEPLALLTDAAPARRPRSLFQPPSAPASSPRPASLRAT